MVCRIYDGQHAAHLQWQIHVHVSSGSKLFINFTSLEMNKFLVITYYATNINSLNTESSFSDFDLYVYQIFAALSSAL